VINEIAAQEEGIGMAGEDLLTISRYELDRQCEIVDARRAGLSEGREEERRETVRRLKDMGLPPDQIAKAAGLDPEETV
jgi:hypothetical protein